GPALCGRQQEHRVHHVEGVVSDQYHPPPLLEEPLEAVEVEHAVAVVARQHRRQGQSAAQEPIIGCDQGGRRARRPRPADPGPGCPCRHGQGVGGAPHGALPCWARRASNRLRTRSATRSAAIGRAARPVKPAIWSIDLRLVYSTTTPSETGSAAVTICTEL